MGEGTSELAALRVESGRVSSKTGDPARRLSNLRSESGFEVLEFAMVLPILALVALLLISFVRTLYYYINLTNVANDGARIAAVSSLTMPNGSPQLGSYLCSQFAALRNGQSAIGHGTVTVSYGTASKAVGDPVTVRIATTYHIFKFEKFLRLPSLTLNLAGASTMRLENPPAATGANYAASTDC